MFTLVFNETELVSEYSCILLFFLREWGRDEVLTVLMISYTSSKHFKTKPYMWQCVLVRMNSEWFCPKGITACMLLFSWPAPQREPGLWLKSWFSLPECLWGNLHFRGWQKKQSLLSPKPAFTWSVHKRTKLLLCLFTALHIWARVRESLSLD